MTLAGTAVHSFLAYGFLLVLVRFAGKRLIRQASTMDLVAALVLGELVDKVLTGKVPFAQYATASLAIIAIHRVVEVAIQRSSVASGWLSGREQPLVKAGRLVSAGMRAERMSERAVRAALRTRGARDLRAIKVADLETNGEVSVLQEDWAREAQQQDAAKLPAARKLP
jgi:uncharacterized membrane protein YcaP (DUF421 family)